MNIIPNNEWIKTDEDPILRKKLNELTFPLSKTDGEYLEKMINYIDSTYEGNNEKYHTKPGVAIAANQVG
jgi:peptide deformylase